MGYKAAVWPCCGAGDELAHSYSAAAEAKGYVLFPRLQEELKSQQKFILGCICAYILLKCRGELIRTRLGKGGSFQLFLYK